MCGIAGWYRRAGREVPHDVLVHQCDRIIHRGPDDCGYLADGDFGFGMRRLSIIDIAGGHQPIDSPDGRYAIVFNGEIYNHPELRRELETLGYAFHTHSDTETLLASFVCWGDDAWPRLQGMYAAAIWDRAERTLTLARDPLGIKPLYITEQNGGLAFASEIRSLRVLPRHSFDLDERAAHDFFMFGHVQRPRSIYRQVRSLEPGHVLRIGPEGEPSIREFWAPRFNVRHDLSQDEWIEETRSRLEGTVRKHMLSDVPVGAFLSGGVDSSAIVAAMTRFTDRPIKAFTVSFPGTSIDEAEAAGRIAGHLGCEHIVLPLEPVAAGDLLPSVQAAFDEPCAATAAVPIWHLSKLAAEHVKVVLAGEGSDEIFAGYKRQRTALLAARYKPLLKALSPLADLIDALPLDASTRFNYLKQNARRFRTAAGLENGFQRFFQATQISTPDVRARLYEPGFLARQDGPGRFKRLAEEYFGDIDIKTLNPLEQFMLADIAVHMPRSLLLRSDRGSMAHSLEIRVPFLSHDFVDWTLTMPSAMKLQGKTGKYALRKAVEPWFPPGSFDKRKIGFQLPFGEWFRGDFSQFAQEAWHESGAMDCGLLQTAAVDQLFAEHRAGLANHGRILYAIAMFSCWWQQAAANGESPA
ncbi:asparagine synthase (glutamine-hydrolyzing) [Croceicoccus estronivorus]|uniref:asparagine synthase (glutamine-hydrolyzing) n=1 Tax=Croceicoccus estronivorus TaxID=1172626 RepID=UPI00082D3583|nr:asparagine synthase (glutamine-hydrolyzing) [Croceicoccus estronivorus]OCC24120.1 asparagine synthase (glutamine-hydrolyzing) [Croceicoccus estronivorus]